MTKYATRDNDGTITGHYDSDIHQVIPPGAVQITDSQWQLSMAGRLWIDPETGAVTELPERPSIHHIVVDGAWVIDLAALYERQMTQLKTGCEAACRGGWTSEALGAPHTYDTDKDRDQVTLTALAVAALQQIMLGNTAWTYDVTCTAADGVKAMRPHNATQLAQVGTEVQGAIASYKTIYYQKLAALDAAYAANDPDAMLSLVSW